jgi:hypothetical protein|nr:MAG TPA: hypothetical protein [Caudoviricetes sp.]
MDYEMLNTYKVSDSPYALYANKFTGFTIIDNIIIFGVLPRVIFSNIKLNKNSIKIVFIRIGRTFNWDIIISHNDVTLLERSTKSYLIRKSDRASYKAMEDKIVQCLNLDIDELIRKGKL